MEDKQITKEVIDAFFAGHDPMERIIKFECAYDEDKVSIIYRNEKGEKRIKREEFKPFVWSKKKTAQLLFGGNREITKRMMAKYHIGCKALRIHRNDGTIPERMVNGYNLMFYAKEAMSFSQFMSFFEKGGRPIYPKQRDENYGLKDYICVAPVEQFMIATGKRQFKGYDDYNDLVRVQWDLETTGLNAERDMIDQIGIRSNKGFEKVISVTGEGEEKFDNETRAIGEQFEIFRDLQPDIVSGHNSENFDWPFEDVRLKKRGFDLKSFTDGTFRQGIYKKKKQSVLKLGGEMEYYYPTVMWGHNITDSMFAVRRAMAVNSNIKSANLKYITKYSKLNKDNRVYVPGKLISQTWKDKENMYLFNDEDGQWLKYDPNKTYQDEVKNGVEIHYDIPISRYYEEDGRVFDKLTETWYTLVTGEYIVKRYLLDDLWETDKVEYKYNVTNFFICKMLPVPFEKCCTMGTAAVWKYIMLTWSYENGLAIPQLIDTKKFTGGLSRLLKCGFIKKQAKLDFNSLYPSIILTFGIRTEVDLQDTMPNLLEYLLTQREYYKDLKKKKIKESEALAKEIENTTDKKKREELEHKKKEIDAIANLYDNTQTCIKLICNGFFGSYGSGQPFPHSDILCAEQTTCIGRQALRLMIHHFSNLSKYNGENLGEEYNYVPVVGDTDGFNFELPEKYRYTDEHPYISNGQGRNTKKGKAYTEVDADIAEFEDTFMNRAYDGGINKMGLGLDEYIANSLNLSRKNYIDLFPDGSLKFVGNTVKSKKMPKYIERFLSENVILLLHGDGQKFLNAYYDYVEKICNLQIPLQEIATVGKIKTSLETYRNSCKELTAAGTKKSRQAWYELAIKEKLNVNMGDSIYYINTGKKKDESDIKRVTHYIRYKDGEEEDITKLVDREYNKAKKNTPDKMKQANGKWINKFEFAKRLYGADNVAERDELVFNCVLLNNDIVEDEEEHYCDGNFEYNVAKYVRMFNNRIKPLLVCFSRELRTCINEKGKEVDNILINDPSERKVFTKEECKLVSGQPYNATDQDTYEELMTMEDKEIKFWLTVNKIPPYVNEIGMDWEQIKADYLERQKQLERAEIKEIKEKYDEVIDKMTKAEVEAFIDEGELPEKLLKLIDEDANSNNFLAKGYDVVIGNIFDIIDKQLDIETEDGYQTA